MTVYLIAEVQVTDPAWVPDYAANVHEIAAKFNGRYLSRSGNIETLKGEKTNETLIAVSSFPDRDDALAFANSPDYAPYRQARSQGSISHLRLIDDTDIAGAIPYLGKAG